MESHVMLISSRRLRRGDGGGSGGLYTKNVISRISGFLLFLCQIMDGHHHHSHPSWWGSVSCYSAGASSGGPSVVVGRCVVLLPHQRTSHASRRVCARTKRNSVAAAAAELAAVAVVGGVVAAAGEQDCPPPNLLRLVHVALPVRGGMDVVVEVLVLVLGWLPVDAIWTHRRKQRFRYFDFSLMWLEYLQKLLSSTDKDITKSLTWRFLLLSWLFSSIGRAWDFFCCCECKC